MVAVHPLSYGMVKNSEAMFVSYAHSDEDITKTIDAIKAYR